MPSGAQDIFRKHIAQQWHGAAFIFLAVLLAALFGILTRPIGFLAAVWPANAILLALFVRNPSLSKPLPWLAAFLGYLAADLVTGGGLLVTLWLTAANMVGVAVGYLLFMRLAPEDRRLDRPISIVSMFCICAVVATATGIVGSGAATLIFDRDMLTGFAFWFTTELVNAIIVLPVILTAPSPARLWHMITRYRAGQLDLRPIFVLLLTTAGGIIIGGPGAFAYPVPVLLWCALTYGLFGTAVVTMLFCVAQLIAAAAGVLPTYVEGDEVLMTVSIRLAVALIALGPLAVASINDARNELLRRLQHTADHDALTGTLSRSAFMNRGSQMLAASGGKRPAVSVFMLDIDHFKSVNDRYGHATGDHVLRETARAISATLRSGDLFGRLGGEEFAVICTTSSGKEATAIAERIRHAVEALQLPLDCDEKLSVTISIGVAGARDPAHRTLDTLLAAADNALYEAKAGGRNRVCLSLVAPPLFDDPPSPENGLMLVRGE